MRTLDVLLATAIVVAGSPLTAQIDRAGLRERLRARMAASDNTSLPTGVDRRTLATGAATRDYLLLDARRDKAPAPLVIALHGGGGNGKTMVPRWADKARAEGIVVAFPDGVGRDGRMATWNAGGCCGQAMATKSDDVGFIGALIDELVRSGVADPKRVYVTGMSNGGMLTHKVAIALSGKIAAAAVVAGAMFGDEAARGSGAGTDHARREGPDRPLRRRPEPGRLRRQCPEPRFPGGGKDRRILGESRWLRDSVEDVSGRRGADPGLVLMLGRIGSAVLSPRLRHPYLARRKGAGRRQPDIGNDAL